MKNKLFYHVLFASTILIGLGSCSKNDNNPTNTDINTASIQAVNDFVNVVIKPTYTDFVKKSTTLNNAVKALVATPTIANQTAAQTAWKDVRRTWEQSEGFLIGPVEDNDYDPNMDTWPTDKVRIDSLLSKNPNMSDDFLNDVDQSLKGFHPLEYYLWDFDPATYTSAQKNYMTALAANILDQTNDLYNSWFPNSYANNFLNPNASNAAYKSYQDVLNDVALKLIDICNEVGQKNGEGKMYAPYAAMDSTLSESPYSHNSIIDFKNNIQGALNSYTCAYNGKTGTSLSSIVQINNRNLDNQIKQAFNTALSSFGALDGITFEKAIYTDGGNRTAVLNIINNIESLQTLLDNQLIPYIQQYIKN